MSAFDDRLQLWLDTAVSIAASLLEKNGEVYPVTLALKVDGTPLVCALDPPEGTDAVAYLDWVWPQLKTASAEGWQAVGVLHDASVERDGVMVDAFVGNVDDKDGAASVIVFYERDGDEVVLGDVFGEDRDNVTFGPPA